ncbi:MAG: glycosyltransferase family 4 protein [Thermoplasmataceae archaeon]
MTAINGKSVALVNDSPLNVGITSYIHDLYRGLKQSGVNVTLYQFLPRGMDNWFPGDGKPVYGFRFPIRKVSLELNQITGMNVRMTKSINADLVHLSNPALIPAKRGEKSITVTVHDMYHLTVKHKWLPRSFFNVRWYERIELVDRIIAVSQFTKSEIIKFLGISPGRISVVYNSVQTDYFTPQKSNFRAVIGLNPEDKVLLNVGRDQPNKNMELLYRSLAELPQNFKLIRIGKNSAESFRLSREMGLSSRIIFLENPSRSELREAYRISDIYVQPSFYEGFGRPLVEAMSCGVPVISSGFSALPEVVGDAGIILRNLSVEELVSRVHEICGTDIRDSLIDRGIRRASEFSTGNNIPDLLKAYESVLSLN